MDDNARELVTIGDRLFTKKAQLDELWQTLAEQVYPERANFTVSRIEGDEYVRDLYESGPAQNRRDLAGAIGAILRPRGKEWFRPQPVDEWRRTDRAMEWCDWARDILRRVLYTERSRFQKTMADADDDFVTFGNSLPILTEDPDRNGFLFELSHLKNNAWSQNRYSVVDVNHRKFKWEIRQVAQKWGESKLTEAQKKILEKNPHQEVEIRHVVMPADDYGPYAKVARKYKGRPFASIYINTDGQNVLSEGGYFEFPYLHRRWRVPDDSVYGYSPASMLGLVDARVLQSQARVILDAGELAVAPPLLAKRDAILGGVNNYAGSVTWIDTEYDERFGEAIRAMENGADVRLGLEMKVDTRNILQAAWYLNKLALPSDGNMTAYEVSERIAEYIRSAGPIFEPFEADNARILDTLFSMMLRLGYLGPIESIPPEVRGGEIKFEFDTPVSQAYQRVKVMRAKEVIEVVGPIMQIDPAIRDNYNLDKMARDTTMNLGADASWLVPEDQVKAKREQDAQKQAELEQAMKAKAAAEVADKAGGAGAKFATAAEKMPGFLAQSQALAGANGIGMPGQGQQQDDMGLSFPRPYGEGQGQQEPDTEDINLEDLTSAFTT